MVGPPFQVHFYTIFFPSPLKAFTQPLMVWNSYMWFLVLMLLGLVFLLLFFLGAGVWFSTLPYSGPMLGTCISSGFCISALVLPAIGLAQSRWFCPVEQSPNHAVYGWYGMMAVPMQVLISMCWLSVDSGLGACPSSSGKTNISRKGIEPSSLGSSEVNCILLWMELRWSKKTSFWSFLMTVKASPTNIIHIHIHKGYKFEMVNVLVNYLLYQ